MSLRTATITPARAQYYLDNTTDNYRRLDPRQVETYARLMRNGEWEAEVSLIVIGEDGQIYDGQHRLAAQVKSNTSQRYIIRDSASKTIVSKIDAGKPRTITDMVRNKKESDSTFWTQFATAVLRYEYSGIVVEPYGFKITSTEVNTFMDTNEDFNKLAEGAQKFYKIAKDRTNAVKIPGAQAAFLYYVFAKEAGEALADEFMSGVFDPTIASPEAPFDPRYVVQNWILWNTNGGSKPFQVATDVRRLRKYMIVAWKLWLAGEKINGVAVSRARVSLLNKVNAYFAA